MDPETPIPLSGITINILQLLHAENMWHMKEDVDWSLAERGVQYLCQAIGLELNRYPYEKPIHGHVYDPRPLSPAPSSQSILQPPSDRYAGQA